MEQEEEEGDGNEEEDGEGEANDWKMMTKAIERRGKQKRGGRGRAG